jgi:hypothetical protein
LSATPNFLGQIDVLSQEGRHTSRTEKDVDASKVPDDPIDSLFHGNVIADVDTVKRRGDSKLSVNFFNSLFAVL